MPSSESLRFIRVNYRDNCNFPWHVMWGADHVWSRCRTRDHALDIASRLRGVVDVFHEWVLESEGEDE